MNLTVCPTENFGASELVKFDDESNWVEGRHASIGSSDGAVILGYGYAGQSKYSLWAEKVHGVRPEFSAAQIKLFKKGHLAEPYLRGLCELELGWQVETDPKPSFRKSTLYPWLTCSLDAFMVAAGEYVAIEYKNINSFSIRSEWDVRSGKAPLKYTIQLQHQLAVTGWKRGYVIALSGMDMFPIEVQRHDGLIDGVIAEYQDFWKLVQEKKEPEIDGSEATQNAINQVVLPRPKECQHLDDEDSALIDMLREFEQSIDDDQKKLAQMENQLARVANGAEYLCTSDGVMYSYKSVRGGKKKHLKLFKGKRS